MDFFLFNTHNKNIWVFKSKSHLVKIKSSQFKKNVTKYTTLVFLKLKSCGILYFFCLLLHIFLC